jgi:type I restriction enzyme S subunit
LKSQVFQEAKDRLCTGATQKSINNQNIGKLRIPLPSLKDQNKLSEILNTSESLKINYNEVLFKYNQLAESIFYYMFGDPIKNEKGWEVKELQNLCTVIVDCPHSTPTHSSTSTNYPCIRTSEMKNGKINWGSMKYLNIEEYTKRIKRLTPLAGDIIYAREGTYGVAVILPENYHFALGQRTMLLRPNKTLTNNYFLWYQINSDFVYRQAKRKNMGSTVGHVNVADVKKFSIINPPLSLQNKFGHIIENLLSLEIYCNLIQDTNLNNSLIQKAFNGELVV